MATAARYLLSHVDDYPSKKQELLASPAPHFVLFNADPDPATGLPWCPDCVRTVPTVKSVVDAAGGTLLEVQVGPRAAWKTPDHPFRLDTTLHLTGIPTLLKLSASGEESVRLGKTLEECRTPQAVEELMAPLVADT